MKNKHIEKITKACIEANSEIASRWLVGVKKKEEVSRLLRPIQLSDVLLIVAKTPNKLSLSADGILNIGNDNLRISRKWNLKKTFEEQDEPTLQFIADLL